MKNWNFDANKNDSKSHVCDSFFRKYYFGYTAFLHSSTGSSGRHQSFFYFRFSSRKSQSQRKKLVKKITHFIRGSCSKNLTHFMSLIWFGIENNMLPKDTQKHFSLYKFFNKHVSVWCQKKKRFSRQVFLNNLDFKVKNVSKLLVGSHVLSI